MSDVDNLLAAVMCAIGVIACIVWIIRVRRDTLIALMALIVLAISGFLQLSVVTGYSHVIANDWYEVGAEMLIVVVVVMILTRHK